MFKCSVYGRTGFGQDLPDGWVRVLLDGERTWHEWRAEQVVRYPAGPPPLLSMVVTHQDGRTTEHSLCRAIADDHKLAAAVLMGVNLFDHGQSTAVGIMAMYKDGVSAVVTRDIPFTDSDF